MNKPPTICGYCGDTSATITRDHVVPKAFWKDTIMPSNPITIPACRGCQTYWDAETTYFRNMLVVQAETDAHPGIQRLIDGPIKRRINRSKPDFNDLTRNASFAWRRTNSGIYTERGVRIEIDVTRFSRTPEKIVRGLFFLRNQTIVPDDYVVRVFPDNTFWDDAGFKNILESMHGWQGCGDDVFQMRATRDHNDPDFTAWLLMFFRSLAILAYTCPASYGENAA